MTGGLRTEAFPTHPFAAVGAAVGLVVRPRPGVRPRFWFGEQVEGVWGELHDRRTKT